MTREAIENEPPNRYDPPNRAERRGRKVYPRDTLAPLAPSAGPG
jgi:hypothetical protein